MRPTLQNYPVIAKLSQGVADSMTNLVSAIKTGWNVEHNGDGTHAAVTATAATVTGLTTLGKLRLSYADWYDDGVVGNHNNLVSQPSRGHIEEVAWLRIYPAQSLGAQLDITGITAQGRAAGDLLLVSNVDSDGAGNQIWFHLENANSAAANRFLQIAAPPATPFVLARGRAVWLIYDFHYTSFTSSPTPRWRIIEQS